MPTIHFETPEGRLSIASDEDLSVMQLAKNEGVPGIDADCGGQMVCGTCHVHADAARFALLPPPGDMEEMILENVPDPHPLARLSCQLRLREMPDGITFTIPAEQR